MTRLAPICGLIIGANFHLQDVERCAEIRLEQPVKDGVSLAAIIGLDEVAQETVNRHIEAYSDTPILKHSLDVGGDYALRERGETHAWTSDEVTNLQHAVRGKNKEKYNAFAKSINDHQERLLTIRGLFRLKYPNETGLKPVKIEDVEPAVEIVKRFSTGAMSYGSISAEAHENLAIAMNKIGGKSNAV